MRHPSMCSLLQKASNRLEKQESRSANINGSRSHLKQSKKKNLHLGKQMAVSGEIASVVGVAVWLAEPAVMHGLPKPQRESEVVAVSPSG